MHFILVVVNCTGAVRKDGIVRNSRASLVTSHVYKDFRITKKDLKACLIKTAIMVMIAIAPSVSLLPQTSQR